MHKISEGYLKYNAGITSIGPSKIRYSENGASRELTNMERKKSTKLAAKKMGIRELKCIVF